MDGRPWLLRVASGPRNQIAKSVTWSSQLRTEFLPPRWIAQPKYRLASRHVFARQTARSDPAWQARIEANACRPPSLLIALRAIWALIKCTLQVAANEMKVNDGGRSARGRPLIEFGKSIPAGRDNRSPTKMLGIPLPSSRRGFSIRRSFRRCRPIPRSQI